MLSRQPITALLPFLVGVGLAATFLARNGFPQEGYLPPVAMPPQNAMQQRMESSSGSNGFGEYVNPEQATAAAVSDPMLWQQYQAVQMGVRPGAGSSTCSACSEGGRDRCGCNVELFPWIHGPGACDQWCVGPKWDVELSGMMMFRDNADWNRVIADVGGATSLVDQFGYGPGARLFATAYSCAGYGVQVGYEGINQWDANLNFLPVAGVTRNFGYTSSLNSVEINYLPQVASPWKWFSGFRYIELDENFLDSTQSDIVLPAPADPPGTVQTIDPGFNRLLDNRLFGLQLGGRRDAWQLGSHVTLQTFANAGMYINKFKRYDVDYTVTTTVTGDDTSTPDVTELDVSSSTFSTATRRDLTEISFAGEAGISAAWRLNYCTALTAGYQILAIDGVGTGLEASFIPGLPGDTLVFHGLQFGFEYRR